MRVVATLTTLPGRYKLLHRMLKSLQNQTVKFDCIYLAIPYKAKRLNQVYPELPTAIQKLCTIVRIDQDYGPICKLYGALMNEHDPETIIVSIDDDTIYHPDLVKTLLEKSKIRPTSAITGSSWLVKSHWFFNFYSNVTVSNAVKSWVGFKIPESGRKIDILVGSSGVLYKRGFFPVKDRLIDDLFSIAMKSDDLFKNDDVVISAYLCSKNIDRIVFKNMPVVNNDVLTADALSADYYKMMISFFNAVQECKDLGLLYKCEDLYYTDSPVITVTAIALLITIIVVIVIVVIRYQREIRKGIQDFHWINPNQIDDLM